MQDRLFQSEAFGTAGPATATIIFICPYNAPIDRVRFAIRRLLRAGYHVVAYETTTTVFTAADPAILPELITRVRQDIRSRIAALAAEGVTEFGFFGSSLGSFILYNCVGQAVPELRWGVFNTGGNIAQGMWTMSDLRQLHIAREWSLPRLEEEWAKLQWPDFGPLDGCRFVFVSSRRDTVAPLRNITQYVGPMLQAGAEVTVREVPAVSHRTTVIAGLWKAPQLIRTVRRPSVPRRRPLPEGRGEYLVMPVNAGGPGLSFSSEPGDADAARRRADRGDGRMTSWVVWAVTVAVAALIGFAATHFSVRTLRYVTAVIVIALLVAVTAYGQTPDGQVPTSLENAFVFGADRLAGEFFRPLWRLWSSQHGPAPGRLGWSVIAAALLLGYRQAEKWALRRQAPQLDTSRLTEGQPSITGDGNGAGDGGPTAGQRHDWLAAEAKFRLAAVDVYSPPILPGGTRSNGLASIAEASGVSGGGLAGAVIRFLGALWPAPRRYELRVWVEGAEPRSAVRTGGARAAISQAGTALARTARAVTIAPGTPKAVTVQAGTGTVRDADAARAATTRVTIELDEPAAGQTVASKTIAAESIDEAASMVAGYVARQIFVRDPASPKWAYGASDGRDLGALLLARQERVYVESADDVRASRARQIELLWSVTGADRCAGVVRYELAGLEDLEREQLIALRLHAMNREQYPRFFRGAYRLCMSLEMVADPGYTIFNPAAGRVVLDETLDILYRAGRTAIDRCGEHDIHVEAGTTGPSVLSHRLREALLRAAQRELRTLRHQLSFPVVAWNTLRRRDERTTWRPHWRLTTRQSFRDGVCAAELLVAVKHRLNERYLAQRGDPAAGRRPGFAERFWQRKGLRVVSAIVGDATAARVVLQAPFDAWPRTGQPGASPYSPGPDPADPNLSAVPGWVPPTRDRARWLPWQARTTSWSAAYNTACLYAVLVQQGLADEDQVVASLRRVVLNRDSGLERPHDWISNDPDIAPLLRHDSPYRKVRAFLEAQERRDYPMKQTYHVHAEQ